MSRRFTRLILLSVLLLTGEVWAIGLGDIKLESALNEPLRAEIVLLSATPDELADLTVTLAAAETFARYGIDRPFYLQGVEFNVVNGGVAGSVVQVRSRAPITEPFLTFLVDATWSSGQLLREYTVLLDPPTYAPPAVQQAPAVSAPVRSAPSDSGRIEREAAPTPVAQQPVAQQSRQAPRQVQTPEVQTPEVQTPEAQAPEVQTPEAQAPAQSTKTFAEPVPKTASPEDDAPYESADGGDFHIVKGQTLWGVAKHLRPDSRLTMNQTMLGIYEANPDAFLGNINELKANVNIRVPSADEIFQISRGDALREVQRQHNSWGGASSYVAPAPDSGPSLTLVPPDDDSVDDAYDDTASYEPMSREDEIEERIDILESADVPNQQSLIEIRDNELANLRQELADIRGEIYERPVDDTADDAVVDDAVVDDAVVDETLLDDPDAGMDDAAADDIDGILADDDSTVDDATSDEVVEDTTAASNVIRSSPSRDEGIVDKIISFLSQWGVIIGAVLLAAGGLLWFVRRGGDDDVDDSGPWERLDSDEVDVGSFSATETLQAPSHDDAIVVVEQDSGVHPILEDTVESKASDFMVDNSGGIVSSSFGSLEDTFSSDTAVNLDQSDPIAEADFHMAYGLYDQAADLINAALETDPTDKLLMSKLCEIYFVWGNRDAFVDAATRLKVRVGDAGSADWDKIVIMGQQIAADHDMFAGAEIGGATEVVDLSFDDGGAEAGALDMDFGADDGSSDVIDLGKEFSARNDDAAGAVDFDFDEPTEIDSGVVDFDITAEMATVDSSESDATAEMPTIDASVSDATAEMPTVDSLESDVTAESDATAEMPALGSVTDNPTIEEQFAGFDGGTAELPSLDASLHEAISDVGQSADHTAEINLDDLDLGGAELDATEVASLDDLDIAGEGEALTDTGIKKVLFDVAEETGMNPTIDPAATGLVEGLDLSTLEDTGMRLARDETGQNPLVTEVEEDVAEIGFDESLLDSDGQTQILSETMAVDTNAEFDSDEPTALLPNDAATLLAPLDDDDDFNFAKTEALPPEAFTGIGDPDSTAETPAIAETNVDLDLDDLTAALQVSEIGDTMDQLRTDETVEQPRPSLSAETAELPTISPAPEDMSIDLHEARTMTEVGTKLDLARAYVDMGDPAGARSILEEVLDEGDDGQKQQAQQLMDSLPS